MNDKNKPLTPEDVVKTLAQKNIRLKLTDANELAVRGDKDNLTPELIALIKQHRYALKEWLAADEQVKEADAIPVLRDRDGYFPLSHAQRRLWLLDKILGGTPQYNMSAAFCLRGRLDIDALQQALDHIITRHEILRTRYIEVKGEGFQVIDPAVTLPIRTYNATDVLKSSDARSEQEQVASFLQEQVHKPFNLADNIPVRCDLLLMGTDETILLFTMHHIASDEWSLNLITAEFVSFYQALRKGQENWQESMPSLACQYLDYSHWQQEHLSSASMQKALDYWQQQLKGVPELHSLPTDYRRPSTQNGKGDIVQNRLSIDNSRALRDLARQFGVTPFVLLQSTFAILIAKWSGQDDVVMGTPIAGRDHKSLQALIGFFVNTLVLRSNVNQHQSFSTFLEDNKAQVMAAFAHQQLPFDVLVESLSLEPSNSYSPLVQIMFTGLNGDRSQLVMDGLEVSEYVLPLQTSKFDLSVAFVDDGEHFTFVWNFATSVFTSSRIEQMQRSWETLLLQLINNPETRLSELSLLDEAERQLMGQLLPDLQRYMGTIDQLVFEHATKAPDRIAVVDCATGEELTYKALAQRAESLALELQAIDGDANSPVALMVERSIDMVVAMLGIVRAGKCYVPIAADNPTLRSELILADCGAKIMISHRDLATELAPLIQHMLWLDKATDIDTSQIKYVKPQPDRLAYIIYTSGSTGIPKGVMINQQSVLNLVYENEYFKPATNEVIGQCANHSFDAATYEVWGALANGKCTAIVAKSQLLDTREFGKVLAAHKISSIFLTTAFFNQLSHDTELDLTQLNYLYFGGEAVDINAVNRVMKGAPPKHLVHVYGPTETTTFSAYYLVDSECLDTCPIGIPLTGHTHYVVDDNLQLVPDGIVGELYIGGLGVSKGYVNNPDLTQKAFVKNPFAQEPSVLYRTGDKVRRDAAGNLVFMHRADSQVKLRGFRIELEEIVANLSQVEGVDEAFVTIQPHAEGNRLVAYLASAIAASAPQDLILACQRRLADKLPDYMLPSAYGCCAAFVLTPNGKIDQKALPEVLSIQATQSRVEPRNEVERKLSEMWQELLDINVDDFGVTDNFFELGAHSITAVKLEFSVRETYGSKLSVEDIFNYPSIAELAQIIMESDEQAMENIPLADRSQPIPLSYGQRRLWFIDQIQGQSAEYNMPNALRFRGKLDITAMRSALNVLITRHESLRTCFHVVGDQPVQHIQEVSELPFTNYDLSDLTPDQAELKVAQLLKDIAREPFDLSSELMLKVTFINIAPNDTILMFNQHHIASDGWSIDVMTRELMELYKAKSSGDNEFALPPLNVQYADYAAWEQQQLNDRGELHSQLDYWRHQLEDAPAVHNLPLDYTRPREQSFVGNNHLVHLDAQSSKGLRALATQLDVTLFTLLEGIFALLISKWSGENDVLIGTPVAGREHPDLESVIGFFVNNLILRTKVTPQTSFKDYIRATKNMVLEAFANQQVPFDMLVEELNPERSLSHGPLYQIAFLLNPADRQLFSLPSLEIEGVEIGESACKFDLNLIAIEDKDQISLLWEYAASLFKPETIHNMAQSFAHLAQQILSNVEQTVGALSLTDKQALSDFCRWHGKPYVAPEFPLLHQQFTVNAKQHPDAVVACMNGNVWTYQQLEEQSNRVAHLLRKYIQKPDTCVTLLVERDFNMLTGMLAILKAGGAYVPLDTDMPSSRMRDIVQDCGSQLVLCDRSEFASEVLSGLVTNIIDITDDTLLAAQSIMPVEPLQEQHDGNLAYVIYTSGSTGKPKGVMVTHRNVMRLVKNADYVEFLPDDVVAQVSNHSFDAATFEVWGALVNSARLQFIDKPTLLDPIALSDALVAYGISIMFITSPLFNQLVFAGQNGYAGLKYLLVGGDVIDVNSVNQMLQLHRPQHFLNAYGPTENTTFSLTYEITEVRTDSYPIGKSIAGNTHYVLDDNLNHLPPGVIGQLYLGGDGVAKGYINNPELTSQVFIPNPFTDLGDVYPYLYKTGDRVFYNEQGDVFYVGRTDHQVKLRGYRIELSEIQQVLSEFESVDDVLVTTVGEGIQRSIVVYVTQKSGKEQSPEACLKHLKERLPDYMLPSAIMLLDEFPLNTNGKFDRKALPKPQITTTHEKVAPGTDMEKSLLRIWSALFGTSDIGIQDNFFNLGGHSIMATRLVADINREFGTQLNIRIIFENQTIQEQAHLIQTTLSVEGQSSAEIGKRFAENEHVEELEL